MSLSGNSKEVIEGLSTLLADIQRINGLHAELAYRVDKLYHRLNSIADKMFLKTVKARYLLSDCRYLTEQLFLCVSNPDNHTYHLLTNLEKHLDQLVEKTHAFRIKAG